MTEAEKVASWFAAMWMIVATLAGLKLAGAIGWPWLFVWAPIWLPGLVIAVVLVVGLSVIWAWEAVRWLRRL